MGHAEGIGPEWIRGRTIYHIHALGAAGAGGVAALARWLDHVADLGCGAVLLTPVHHSTSHGYDTVDAFRLDERLGTERDFDRFVDECHGRDLRVILDGVFNHVGRQFPRTEWLSGRLWEGHAELPTLDHDNPEVLEWATAVARHWLDRGTDGWRFDVAYSIPTPFLAELTRNIKRSHPDAFLFGEMIRGDYRRLVAGTALDAVTQYELFKAIWSSLNDHNLWELAWALERHAGFSVSFPPVTFLGNHDVTRIASTLHDPRHADLALAVLFTVPGIPCVYYGDEFAWKGVKGKGAGGDDALRPALPAQVPGNVGGLLDLHREWIAFRRSHPELTDAELSVLDRTNTTITYRTGTTTVRLDTVRSSAELIG